MKESFDTCISVTALRHRSDAKAKKNLATRESPLFSITLMELLFCWAHFRDKFLLKVLKSRSSRYNNRRCRICVKHFDGNGLKWNNFLYIHINFSWIYYANSDTSVFYFTFYYSHFAHLRLFISLFKCHIIYDVRNKYLVRRVTYHSFRKSRQISMCGSNLQPGERNNDLHRVEAKV